MLFIEAIGSFVQEVGSEGVAVLETTGPRPIIFDEAGVREWIAVQLLLVEVGIPVNGKGKIIFVTNLLIDSALPPL